MGFSPGNFGEPVATARNDDRHFSGGKTDGTESWIEAKRTLNGNERANTETRR